ncbi:hypothetical protein GGR57DRAFT_498322 [Xylariaceae sp. FL1272]|nr:hypothetical protein GGR57DRAFT_498322 [Xylariaceae sp. FL1272]
MSWDNDYHKCRYPPLRKPECKKYEKPYCKNERNEHCDYNEKDDKCRDDGKNTVYCKKDKDKNEKDTRDVRDEYRYNYDDDDKDYMYEPRGPGGYDGKDWKDWKHDYPSMDKPKCKKGEKAYCAKNKNDWCPYDENREECKKKEHYVTFCCEEGKEQEWCDEHNWND